MTERLPRRDPLAQRYDPPVTVVRITNRDDVEQSDFPDHGSPVATEPVHLVLTIEQAARRLGIGRTLMYRLVMSGEVESVMIGRLRRVPVECLAEYVANLRTSHQSARPAA